MRDSHRGRCQLLIARCVHSLAALIQGIAVIDLLPAFDCPLLLSSCRICGCVAATKCWENFHRNGNIR